MCLVLRGRLAMRELKSGWAGRPSDDGQAGTSFAACYPMSTKDDTVLPPLRQPPTQDLGARDTPHGSAVPTISAVSFPVYPVSGYVLWLLA